LGFESSLVWGLLKEGDLQSEGVIRIHRFLGMLSAHNRHPAARLAELIENASARQHPAFPAHSSWAEAFPIKASDHQGVEGLWSTLRRLNEAGCAADAARVIIHSDVPKSDRSLATSGRSNNTSGIYYLQGQVN
jgi:hypothetical protein